MDEYEPSLNEIINEMNEMIMKSCEHELFLK
jgi:hypothetical protein